MRPWEIFPSAITGNPMNHRESALQDISQAGKAMGNIGTRSAFSLRTLPKYAIIHLTL